MLLRLSKNGSATKRVQGCACSYNSLPGASAFTQELLVGHGAAHGAIKRLQKNSRCKAVATQLQKWVEGLPYRSGPEYLGGVTRVALPCSILARTSSRLSTSSVQYSDKTYLPAFLYQLSLTTSR